MGRTSDYKFRTLRVGTFPPKKLMGRTSDYKFRTLRVGTFPPRRISASFDKLMEILLCRKFFLVQDSPANPAASLGCFQFHNKVGKAFNLGYEDGDIHC